MVQTLPTNEVQRLTRNIQGAPRTRIHKRTRMDSPGWTRGDKLILARLRDTYMVPAVVCRGMPRSTAGGKPYVTLGAQDALPEGVFTLTQRPMTARQADDAFYGDEDVLAAQASHCGPVVCTGYGQPYGDRGTTVRRAYLRVAKPEEIAAIPSAGERWVDDIATSESEVAQGVWGTITDPEEPPHSGSKWPQ